MGSFAIRIKIKYWAIVALILENKSSCRRRKLSDELAAAVPGLFLRGYERWESASEIVRGGKARVNGSRGAHITHARAFSISRSATSRQSLPIGCICARLPNGYRRDAFVTASTRGACISRKRLFEFAPTARVTPARPSINNIPYAVSSRSLHFDARDREVVVYYDA